MIDSQDSINASPVSLCIQPWSGTIRDTLETLANLATGGCCRISTAWMTPDGLALVNDLCLRHNVTITEIVVGINRAGTSARALRAALDVLGQFDGTLRYYLDGLLSGPIFHPKLWLFEANEFRAALIGSANLTREGLLNNFEAIVVLSEKARHRNEGSPAIDQAVVAMDLFAASLYCSVVDQTVIGRLVEIGAIPEVTERAQRSDADGGISDMSTADRALNVREARIRRSYQPRIPLPDSASAPGNRGPGVSTGILAVPAGQQLRYVRYYGLAEANRVQKYFREAGSAGTFEVNITMTTPVEQEFWGYPGRFAPNQRLTATEWSPRVRLITNRSGSQLETVIPAARLWTRLREGRQTEVRFRFANAAAVRTIFPLDIGELTVMVVDRAEDPGVDFEVRLVGRRDPGYSALCPTADRNYEYRFV